MPAGPGEVLVEVVFDTICPWCYLGKRRLDAALSLRRDTPVRVVWRPFLLNPEMPKEGMDRRKYLMRKYGSDSRVAHTERSIAGIGRAEGIEFAFERIAMTPNSLLSHRLVRLAAVWGMQSEAVEAVFHAFFVEGHDIGSIGVLLAIAEALGIPASRGRLEHPDDWDDLRGETVRAHRYGVNGVPCFIFQERYSLAGAQETPVLARMIDLAHQTSRLGAVQTSAI